MSKAHPPIDPEDEAVLRRLLQMDMAAAEKAHAKLMEAEEAPEIATTLLAYNRAARSARQTLMLKARLVRMAFDITPRAPGGDTSRLATLSASLADAARDEALGQRIEALHDAVGRVIAAAHPDDPARQDALAAEQDALIDAEIERPDFLHHPLDAHVATQCEQLGLPRELAARWRNLPKAPRIFREDADILAELFDDPPDPERRESG